MAAPAYALMSEFERGIAAAIAAARAKPAGGRPPSSNTIAYHVSQVRHILKVFSHAKPTEPFVIKSVEDAAPLFAEADALIAQVTDASRRPKTKEAALQALIFVLDALIAMRALPAAEDYARAAGAVAAYTASRRAVSATIHAEEASVHLAPLASYRLPQVSFLFQELDSWCRLVATLPARTAPTTLPFVACALAHLWQATEKDGPETAASLVCASGAPITSARWLRTGETIVLMGHGATSAFPWTATPGRASTWFDPARCLAHYHSEAVPNAIIATCPPPVTSGAAPSVPLTLAAFTAILLPLLKLVPAEAVAVEGGEAAAGARAHAAADIAHHLRTLTYPGACPEAASTYCDDKSHTAFLTDAAEAEAAMETAAASATAAAAAAAAAIAPALDAPILDLEAAEADPFRRKDHAVAIALGSLTTRILTLADLDEADALALLARWHADIDSNLSPAGGAGAKRQRLASIYDDETGL